MSRSSIYKINKDLHLQQAKFIPETDQIIIINPQIENIGYQEITNEKSGFIYLSLNEIVINRRLLLVVIIL